MKCSLLKMENKKIFINQKSFNQSRATRDRAIQFSDISLSHFSNIISKSRILPLLHLEENNINLYCH